MYTAEKRRVRDAEKRMERLHYKFISEYVKVLHGDIYEKAENLYQTTRQKYPRVKDLTKTMEYVKAVTPHKPVPRYYMSRKTNTEMEMVLQIPLLSNTAVASRQPPAVSSPQPPAVAVSSPQPPAVAVSSPQPPAVSSPQPPAVASPQPPAVSSPQPPAVSSLPLPLSDEVFKHLLQDLQQDPDLMNILDGFLLNDNDSMVDTTNLESDIWASIRPEENTPLEKELCNVFIQ